MIQHKLSPWLFEIKKQRKTKSLTKSFTSDVIIVGGGISGVITSYYILKNTKYDVNILEANTIASGATGRNAGQLTTNFEASFQALIKIFGIDKVLKGQLDIENTWILLKKIIKDTNITTKVDIFNGLTGYISYEQVYEELLIRKNKNERNIKIKKILISNEANFLNKIPPEFNIILP